jgi:hypothetical protein
MNRIEEKMRLARLGPMWLSIRFVILICSVLGLLSFVMHFKKTEQPKCLVWETKP